MNQEQWLSMVLCFVLAGCTVNPTSREAPSVGMPGSVSKSWNQLMQYKGRQLAELPESEVPRVHRLITEVEPMEWVPVGVVEMRSNELGSKVIAIVEQCDFKAAWETLMV